jgi:hypothetical protein
MGVIADMIRAGVDPELVERAALELSTQARPAKERRVVKYTDDFEAFWKAYPTDQNMSKLEAFQVWQKIAPEERELAVKAIPPFKAWIKTQTDYRTIHACRFLSKKRYEGHAQPDLKLVASNVGTYVKRDSADWGKYAEAYRAQKGKYPPTDKNGGWFFAEAIGE